MADGRRIKRGLLFRSGSLERLTENDCTFLAGVPVRSVLDYRDADEVQAKPDILWSGADYHHVPANPLSSEVNANTEAHQRDAGRLRRPGVHAGAVSPPAVR